MNNIETTPLQSPHARLYMDLSERIAGAVPEITFIDQYLGQEQSEVCPALAYPAALIDMEDTDYSGMGALSQLGTVTVSVRLALDNYASSEHKAPLKTRKQALRNYELEHKLVAAIHGWAPPDGYAQPLWRTADRSENYNNIGLRIRVITFTTQWEAMIGE